MATGFTEQEKIAIRQELKEYARECIKLYGAKRTTVDQLVEKVGISKGAFYKFFDTKELLCFEIAEGYHTEVYGEALKVFQTRMDLSEKDRMAEALLAACKLMEENSMMDMMENDMPYILRKLPTEIVRDHYHSDDVHIKELIEASGISLKVSTEFASAVVRGLIIAVSHRMQIGEEYYDKVLELLIRGACDRLLEAKE